ncbi:hypothetical protein [Thiocystis violacea]|uniref:hypothetical protein n=1 Tax=Thiocystis violacea TaxID=13725 RepID=UPI001907B8F3|nr:hypothetical protein [Thiocystis violacea]MBK1721944.1 hypothetical protein [Thiocystis violacea]
MLTPQMCAEIKSAADVADLIAVLESWGWVDLWLTMATTPRQGRKNTSPEAARELHALGSLCLAHGYSEMPEGLRSFLASTLMGVAQGQDASTAMHVKRRAGVSLDPIDQLWWEHRVAAQVGLLVDHLLMSEPDANEVVAELLQGGIREIDAPMVKVYWKRHRDRRRALSLAPCETK